MEVEGDVSLSEIPSETNLEYLNKPKEQGRWDMVFGQPERLQDIPTCITGVYKCSTKPVADIA